MIRILVAAAIAVMGLASAALPAAAQEVARVRDGVKIVPGQTRIMIIQPNIKVGSMSTGGLFEPNAEWTATARGLIDGQVRQQLGTMGVKLAETPAGDEAGAAIASQYRALFPVVAKAVMEFQFFLGNRLPTKKRPGVFDYTLGKDIARMPGAADADYALFLFSEDAYGSAGRKAAQLLMAGLFGVAIAPGVHVGYAGLVDLKTGDLVWLNADPQMGGDVREADGAVKRVGQLLANFPGTAPAPAATAK
ncbi:MAG: hypothetical protein KGQ52_11975 [Alphaproteobacteria bacterium]|nr:hypothetical protein [Alphaproteobacteria bacterium]